MQLIFESVAEVKQFYENYIQKNIVREPIHLKTTENKATKTDFEPIKSEEVPFEGAVELKHTLEELKKIVIKTMQEGKKEEVRQLLEKFHAKRVSSLEPKDYDEFYEEVEKL